MDKKIGSSYYFRDIFQSFLLMSILPFLIFTSSIIFIYHSNKISDVSTNLENRNNNAILQINHLFDDLENLLKSISEKEEILNFLENDANIDDQFLKELIFPYIVGKENKISLHIFNNQNNVSFTTSILPDQYIKPEFKEWGILYELENNNNTVVFPSFIKTESNNISFSLGKNIFNQSNNLIGHIILDINRDYVLSSLNEFDENEYIEIKSLDDIVIINNLDFNIEGKFQNEINDNNFSLNNNEKLFFEEKLDNNNSIKVTSIIKIDNFGKDTRNLINIFLVFTFVVIIISAYFTMQQSNKIYQPIEEMLNTMKAVKKDQKVRMNKLSKHIEMKYISYEFNTMLDTIERLNKEIIEKSKREMLSEMKALQAQISPHFLYNMLNEIKSLAKLGRNEDVSLFIQHLGTMLRRSIDNAEKFVTLVNDLEFIISYLELQKIRYENSFEYVLDIEENTKNILIPNLIIQPIVENSIIHGFSSIRKNQTLKITSKLFNGDLIIEIYDDGRGIPIEKVGYINEKEDRYWSFGNHGLENVQKRLIMTYGIKYGINVVSEVNKFTIVKITIPINGDKNEI